MGTTGTSMSPVRITLFGPPAVIVGDATSPTKFCAAKPLALVAYLTLERGAHARDEIAALLWPESDDRAARASLRQALSEVRACLGEQLRADRRAVELIDPVESDVAAFLDAVERDPARAVEYDVRHFLAGLAPRNAPGFDEWRAATAQRLVQRYHDALHTLIRDARAASDWGGVVRWAERWLEQDPLAEEAARAAMEGLYLGGNPADALRAFERYRDRLLAAAERAPAPHFTALAERIRQARPEQPAASGEPPGMAGPPPFRAHLVGRQHEWRLLTEVWESVARGAFRTVLIEGEQGAGKTRLADDFLQWASLRGAVVLRAAGHDARSGIPYAPIATALRDVLDAPGLGGTDPEWLTEVARLVPDLRRRFPHMPQAQPPASGTDRWRLFEGVAQVLLAVATDHPVVLAIDDLQWCDADSCALLHFLPNRLERSPAALVVTVTLGDLHREIPSWRLQRALRSDASTVVVPVRSLGAADVRALLCDIGRLDAAADVESLAASICGVTDGNPFYIIELLKTLHTQGVLVGDPATGRWRPSAALRAGARGDFDMPTSMQEAIAPRVDRLPYEMRDVLATLALAGRAVGADLISEVHGISRLRAAALADALVERMLLSQEQHDYRCAHPVIGDVVRGLLTPARRTETHRAIALAMEVLATPADRRTVAGEIARHAQRGNEPGMAYTYALLASDEATARYAVEEALAWLDLAAAAAGNDAEASREVDRRTDALLPLLRGSAAHRVAGPLRGLDLPPAAGARASTPDD